MIDEIRALVEMGYTLPDAKELVMADKKANSMQTVTTHASLKVEDDAKSPATSVQKAHSIVAAGNVAVKSKKIFLSADERAPKLEKVKLEIIFQQPKIMSFKRGINSEEIQLSNDVFTVLEHPYKKLASDADKAKKKESLYEAHFRAGLVMTITATIPESGLIPNFKFFSFFSCTRSAG